MQLESSPVRRRESGPEKFLVHGVDVHPSLSSLLLLMSYRTQDYLWGRTGGGVPPLTI